MNSEISMSLNSHLALNDEVTMNLLDHDLSPLSVSCIYSDSNFDDLDGLTRRERILLRPWLENLIDSGQVPGLEWIDRGKYIFKVPWKHRSKKSWSVEHSSVFLEWAKNTGRWRLGDPEPNYAQLKTRLRCAFNKAPDIQEIKELHKTKCEDAYKVYRFVPKKESRFGSFKKKMLIPTSVKRMHQYPWMSDAKVQRSPEKRFKKEETMETQIKLEPVCGSPERYCTGAAPSILAYRVTSGVNPPPSPLWVVDSDISTIDEMYSSKYPDRSTPSSHLPRDKTASCLGSRIPELRAFPPPEVAGGGENNKKESLLQGSSFEVADGYPTCSEDLTYKRNYERHLQIKFNDSKSPYHSYVHVHDLPSYHDPSPYLDVPRRAVYYPDRTSLSNIHQASSHHPKLQSQPESNKFCPSNNDQQMYHNHRMDEMERLNVLNNNQYPSLPAYDLKSPRHADNLAMPQLRGHDLHSGIKSPFCISRPLDISSCSDPSMLAAVSSNSPQTSCDVYFSKQHVHQTPKSSNHVDMRQVGCPDMGVGKVGELSCPLIDGDKMVLPNGHLDPKDEVIRDQLQVMAVSKPAGPNGLDLTKKVKMAVAPFITQPRAQQPPTNLDLDLGKSHLILHPAHSSLDKMTEQHASNPPCNSDGGSGKFLDFLEWERRLIERERELLARERLITLKEKNLRRLELSLRFDYDVARKSSSMIPSRRDGCNGFKVARSLCQPSSPVDFSDHGWPRGVCRHDDESAPSCSSSDDSDVYYSQLFAANNNKYNNNNYYNYKYKHSNGVSMQRAETTRVESLFVGDGRDVATSPTRMSSGVVDHAFPEVLVITRNGESCRMSVLFNEEVDGRDQTNFSDKSDEFGKVLPVVDSLSSEDVLHIVKLPEKISEDMSCNPSGPEGGVSSSSFPSSISADKENPSRKEDLHEEVWKRRMKWKSFQSNSQIKGANNSHWIWPNIGNLGGSQQREQNKLDNSD